MHHGKFINSDDFAIITPQLQIDKAGARCDGWVTTDAFDAGVAWFLVVHEPSIIDNEPICASVYDKGDAVGVDNKTSRVALRCLVGVPWSI